MGTSGFPFLFPLLAELQTHLFKTVLGLIGIEDPAHGRPIGDSLGGIIQGTTNVHRVNEAIGLYPDFIFQGQMDGTASRSVHAALKNYGLCNYHGFIAR